MPSGRQVHRGGTRVLSGLMVALGLVMVVLTVAQGGGPLARGVIVGILFVVAGAARLWLQERHS